MSLFVRLDVGFWTHRKTMRLRALIGDAAFWIPPRLWSYAAQNQPDGDFSAYMPEELAMLVGCSTDPKALLEALQHAGFMDGMKIHGWADHNGYHEKFAARAKKAAEARWRGRSRRDEKKGQEKRQAVLGDAKSSAYSIPLELQGEDFRKAWNEWYDYRKQAKLKTYTQIGADKQLKDLAVLGTSRAVAAINHSIANGYQGIFEPKSNGVKPAAVVQPRKPNYETPTDKKIREMQERGEL